jgi:hypothetical protein
MSHPATPSRFIGCDVGKTAIVVFDTASGATRAIANEPQALSDFAASLEATCFVVCEATGGYERDLLAALIAAGVPACRADARKVKAFIRSFGTLGKSDAVDATALARYGLDRYAELPLWSAREPKRERLQALVLVRRDLVKDRLAYANRRTAPPPSPSALISTRSSKASRRKSTRSKPTSRPCAPRASRSPRPSMSKPPPPSI